jgi:putative CocE/NonD family hydrolase
VYAARVSSDAHWLGERAPAIPSQPARAAMRSLYVTMRDGVRLAIDVHVPDGEGRRATILRQTRYLRALSARSALRGLPLGVPFDLLHRTRQAFLAAGYAWVDVDVRGTGASFGGWPYPWAKEEVEDGREIVDWIVRQPWSDGSVGTLGISYDGTCAEMLLVNRHPAVRAIAPMFSLHDVFRDVAFPGGVHLSWFTEAWSTYNAALDANDFPRGIASVLWQMARGAEASPAPHGLDVALRPLARLGRERFDRMIRGTLGALFEGARVVDGDRDTLAHAVRAHADNIDIHAGALGVSFRDQTGISRTRPDATVDTFSPHAHAAALEESGAAIYSISGWRDGAYPRSAIERFARVRTPGSRLTIGPWVHTGRLRVRPFEVSTDPSFDLDAELLAFFDEALRGRVARSDGAHAHWYTMGEEAWKRGDAWPPPSRPHTLHLGEGRALVTGACTREGGENVDFDPAIGTGTRSRWRTLLALVGGDYPDRRERDRALVCFDSAPLEHDTEVTGHPVLTLFASFAATDGAVFAYLEDVAPDGRVAYVTEGQLRALHRAHRGLDAHGLPLRSFEAADARPLAPGAIEELVIDLLPVSWRFRRGHRFRLALAAGDADHFAPVGERAGFRAHRGPRTPSRIVLPIVSA